MRILKLALLISFLAGTGPAFATEGDYSELFESAVQAVTWDLEETWAYTETTSGSDGDYAARYDPRLPEDRRWTLLSVDGRKPTGEEIAEFLQGKAEEFPDEDLDEDYDEDDGNDADSMVDPGTLELLEETDDYWLFSFVPTDFDSDDEDAELGRTMLESMSGTVKIAKDGRHLVFIDIHNTKPLRPKTGVKMKEFLTRLEFGPAIADGPIVMKSMDVVVKLSAFLVVRVNERESVRFSDFEYAGPADSAASLAHD